jgi:Raf kinase inhibitor-like YbhB/YbcL family protein
MFALTSPAFASGSAIPARYTCDGADRSPPLSWVAPPRGTRRFALLVDDPDAPDPAAPRRVWVHWIRYNLPATLSELAEGAGNRAPDEGARECLTDAGSLGYHGPCPPIGRHRYFFHLFALSQPLEDLGEDARRADLERAMTGLVVGTAVLMGTYQRPSARRAQ